MITNVTENNNNQEQVKYLKGLGINNMIDALMALRKYYPEQKFNLSLNNHLSVKTLNREENCIDTKEYHTIFADKIENVDSNTLQYVYDMMRNRGKDYSNITKFNMMANTTIQELESQKIVQLRIRLNAKSGLTTDEYDFITTVCHRQGYGPFFKVLGYLIDFKDILTEYWYEYEGEVRRFYAMGKDSALRIAAEEITNMFDDEPVFPEFRLIKAPQQIEIVNDYI